MEAISASLISMTVGAVLLSAILLLAKTGLRWGPERYLAAFFIVFGAIKLEELFILEGGYVSYPHLLGITYPLELLLAPAVYFYIRALTTETHALSFRRDGFALVAPLLAASIALPFYMMSAETKVALMSADFRDPDMYARAVLGCQIRFAMFASVSIVYFYKAFALLGAHEQRLLDFFSRIDDKSIGWIRPIIIALVLGWTAYSINEIQVLGSGGPDWTFTMVYQLIELTWAGLLGFFGIRQQFEPGHVKALSVEQPRKGQMTRERLDRIGGKLERCMREDALYQNPNLALRDLSDAIGATENQISEVFSRKFGVNFFDYVNGYRVRLAQQLLCRGEHTVLEIAYQSGFNSRSTFNAAFKKHSGCTPQEYRQKSSLKTAGSVPRRAKT